MNRTKQRWLFLDDDIRRHRGFIKILNVEKLWGYVDTVDHVYRVSDAIERLQERRYDVAWLDHDLEKTDDETGMVVARFITDHLRVDFTPRRVVIHSHNPEGARNMAAQFKYATCYLSEPIRVTIQPFSNPY